MKTSIRKILCTLLSVVVAFSLVACGKSLDVTTGGSDKTQIAEKFKEKNNSKGAGSITDKNDIDNETKESNKDLDGTSKGAGSITDKNDIDTETKESNKGLDETSKGAGSITDKNVIDTEPKESKKDSDIPSKGSNAETLDNDSVDIEELSESDIERIKSSVVNFVISLDDIEIDLKSSNSTLDIVENLGYTYVENQFTENPYGKTLESGQYTLLDKFQTEDDVNLYFGVCNNTESSVTYEDCKIRLVRGEYIPYRAEKTPKLFIVGAKEIQLGSTTFTPEVFDTIFDESYEYETYKSDSEYSDFNVREIRVPNDKYYSSDTIRLQWSSGYLSSIEVVHM